MTSAWFLKRGLGFVVCVSHGTCVRGRACLRRKNDLTYCSCCMTFLVRTNVTQTFTRKLQFTRQSWSLVDSVTRRGQRPQK